MRLRADHVFGIRIEHHQVRVRADRNRALTREQPEKLCGRRGYKLHEPVRRKPVAVHAAGIDEAQPVLDAGAAVGEFL